MSEECRTVTSWSVILHSSLVTLHFSQCPGWESNPQCLEGRPGYSRPGGPPHAEGVRRLPGTDTGGSRTHKPQGLSPVAIPVRVPCRQLLTPHSSKSPRWESNPRFRHTKTAGSRYNTGANLTEPPVGIEPTLPRYEGGRLPLQHGGWRSGFILHPSSFQQSAWRGSNPHRRLGTPTCSH